VKELDGDVALRIMSRQPPAGQVEQQENGVEMVRERDERAGRAAPEGDNLNLVAIRSAPWTNSMLAPRPRCARAPATAALTSDRVTKRSASLRVETAGAPTSLRSCAGYRSHGGGKRARTAIRARHGGVKKRDG